MLKDPPPAPGAGLGEALCVGDCEKTEVAAKNNSNIVANAKVNVLIGFNVKILLIIIILQ